mgnify:FL=1
MMRWPALITVVLAVAVTAPVRAERTDLPPTASVDEVLDSDPRVTAAAARVDAARSRARMLDAGTHEVTVTGNYLRRTIDQVGSYDEFDAIVGRAVRLPGKASLDRAAGTLGVEVAENLMEDARHQAALTLSGLWHDWLLAGELYRNDATAVASYQKALQATERRTALRDAAALDVDQARSALAQAQAQLAVSASMKQRARATLAATYPGLPLPAEPPALAAPVLPAESLPQLRNLVIERSHEIRAAEREAARRDVVARRIRQDRIADPTIGVRVLSERSGMETGIGVVATMPIGGSYRRAAADQASADANVATIDLVQARRMVEATADTDLIDTQTRIVAWQATQLAVESAAAAAQRMARGQKLGAIDLTDLLYAERQANDARRSEIMARAEAARVLFKLRIDSHTIWAPGHEQHK